MNRSQTAAIALAVVLLALLAYVNVQRITNTCDQIERTPGARYDDPTGIWQLPEGDVVGWSDTRDGPIYRYAFCL